MAILFEQIYSFLKLLNSETGTNQIAAGLTCGFILGMTPAFSLQTLLIIFVLFFFRVQIGAAFISLFFFKFIAYLLDPVFHSIGSSVLEIGSLQALYTTLYNMPIIPFTRFNNSIVMGAGVVSIALSPILFFVFRILVQKYRKSVVEKFKESKLWKAIKLSSLYKWYDKYDQIYG